MKEKREDNTVNDYVTIKRCAVQWGCSIEIYEVLFEC